MMRIMVMIMMMMMRMTIMMKIIVMIQPRLRAGRRLRPYQAAVGGRRSLLQAHLRGLGRRNPAGELLRKDRRPRPHQPRLQVGDDDDDYNDNDIDDDGQPILQVGDDDNDDHEDEDKL